LQEVHVETYGSLSKKEKVEFILEQLRLTVLKQDFVRSSIVAGKINRKHLAEMPDYKIRFFTLLATVHRFERNALELVKDYHAVYSTLVQQEEAAATASSNTTEAMDAEDSTTSTTPTASADAWKDALQAVVVFLALSPFGNERQDILMRVSQDERLAKIPACQYVYIVASLLYWRAAITKCTQFIGLSQLVDYYRMTIEMLLKKEIVSYPLPHQQELESLAVVQEGGLGSHWHDTFFRRIIQHNIRVVAMYYTRIHGARLAQLLQLSPDVLEREIASMVSDGTVFAKIDRPADIVRFQAKQSPESILTDWVTDIDELLQLVETTTHLIHKEQMTTAH
jgi:26S proteasome regulatory subunit N5